MQITLKVTKKIFLKKQYKRVFRNSKELKIINNFFLFHYKARVQFSELNINIQNKSFS